MIPEIPNEILTGIGGVMLAALGAAFAHINKSIPLRIVWGKKQDEHYITREELSQNCDGRQSKLDKKLDDMVAAQKELKNMFMNFSFEFQGRLSKIEGRLQ